MNLHSAKREAKAALFKYIGLEDQYMTQELLNEITYVFNSLIRKWQDQGYLVVANGTGDTIDSIDIHRDLHDQESIRIDFTVRE